MERNDERRNRQIAGVTTVVVNALLIVLLFFVAAWRAPDPPLPELGIELNVGLDMQGGGPEQPLEEAGSEVTEDEAVATEPEQAVEESEATPQESITQKESPVTQKETPKETQATTVEKKTELKEIKPVDKPKEEPKTVYTPTEKSGAGDKAGSDKSHGDDTGKTGDKGNQQGSIDAEALYGNQGGGQGGVSMSGFNGFEWPKIKTPAMPDNAYGVYEFTVKIDENGDVISVRPITRGLSLEAEKKLMAVIQDLSFIPKGSNPAAAEGKIAFKIVAGN